jgi:hypothetical protein
MKILYINEQTLIIEKNTVFALKTMNLSICLDYIENCCIIITA